MKTEVPQTTQNKHNNKNLETRCKCKASHSALVVALEQRAFTQRQTVARRFPNCVEERYSVNKVELLGVFWSVECLKYPRFRKNFTVNADHRAILSIIKENWINISFYSRLTRWVDRLLPIDFNIEHISFAKMGLVAPSKSTSKSHKNI